MYSSPKIDPSSRKQPSLIADDHSHVVHAFAEESAQSPTTSMEDAELFADDNNDSVDDIGVVPLDEADNADAVAADDYSAAAESELRDDGTRRTVLSSTVSMLSSRHKIEFHCLVPKYLYQQALRQAVDDGSAVFTVRCKIFLSVSHPTMTTSVISGYNVANSASESNTRVNSQIQAPPTTPLSATPVVPGGHAADDAFGSELERASDTHSIDDEEPTTLVTEVKQIKTLPMAKTFRKNIFSLTLETAASHLNSYDFQYQYDIVLERASTMVVLVSERGKRSWNGETEMFDVFDAASARQHFLRSDPRRSPSLGSTVSDIQEQEPLQAYLSYFLDCQSHAQQAHLRTGSQVSLSPRNLSTTIRNPLASQVDETSLGSLQEGFDVSFVLRKFIQLRQAASGQWRNFRTTHQLQSTDDVTTDYVIQMVKNRGLSTAHHCLLAACLLGARTEGAMLPSSIAHRIIRKMIKLDVLRLVGSIEDILDVPLFANWLRSGLLLVLASVSESEFAYLWLGFLPLINEEPTMPSFMQRGNSSEADLIDGFERAVGRLAEAQVLPPTQHEHNYGYILSALVRFAPSLSCTTLLIDIATQANSSQALDSVATALVKRVKAARGSASPSEIIKLVEFISTNHELSARQDIVAYLLQSLALSRSDQSSSGGLRLLAAMRDAEERLHASELLFTSTKSWLTEVNKVSSMEHFVGFLQKLEQNDILALFGSPSVSCGFALLDSLFGTSFFAHENAQKQLALNLEFIVQLQQIRCNFLGSENIVRTFLSKRAVELVERLTADMSHLEHAFAICLQSPISERLDEHFKHQLVDSMLKSSLMRQEIESYVTNVIWRRVLARYARLSEQTSDIEISSRIRLAISTLQNFVQCLHDRSVIIAKLDFVLKHAAEFKELCAAAGIALQDQLLEDLQKEFDACSQQLDSLQVFLAVFIAPYPQQFDCDQPYASVLRIRERWFGYALQFMSRQMNTPSLERLKPALIWFGVIVRNSETFLSQWHNLVKHGLLTDGKRLNLNDIYARVIPDIVRRWRDVYNGVSGRTPLCMHEVDALLLVRVSNRTHLRKELEVLFDSNNFDDKLLKVVALDKRQTWVDHSFSLCLDAQAVLRFSKHVVALASLANLVAFAQQNSPASGNLRREAESLTRSDFLNQAHEWPKYNLSEAPRILGQVSLVRAMQLLTREKVEFLAGCGRAEDVIRFLCQYKSDIAFQQFLETVRQRTDSVGLVEASLGVSQFRDTLTPLIYPTSPIGSIERIIQILISTDISDDFSAQLTLILRHWHKLREPAQLELGASNKALLTLQELFANGAFVVRSVNPASIFQDTDSIQQLLLQELDRCIVCQLGSQSQQELTVDELLRIRNQLALTELADGAQQLDQFINTCDILLSIRKTIQGLVEAGYFPAMSSEFTSRLNAANLTELASFERSLAAQAQQWRQIVDSTRDTYPHLNYFSAMQIGFLWHQLCQSESGVNIEKVVPLMTFAFPGLSRTDLESSIATIKAELSSPRSLNSAEILKRIGTWLSTVQRQRHQQSISLTTATAARVDDASRDFFERLVSTNALMLSQSSSEEVIKCILLLYASKRRLPQPDEVIACNQERTPFEQILNLLRRWKYSEQLGRSDAIFTIANTHTLPYHLQTRLLAAIRKELQTPAKRAPLVVLSGSAKHTHIITLMSDNMVSSLNPSVVDSFKEVFVQSARAHSLMDVLVFSSGDGKTHQILRLCFERNLLHFRIVIHESSTFADVFQRIHQLDKFMRRQGVQAAGKKVGLHLEIGHCAHSKIVNPILFQLIFLGRISYGETTVLIDGQYLAALYIEVAEGGEAVDLFTRHLLPRAEHRKANAAELRLDENFERVLYKDDHGNSCGVASVIKNSADVVASSMRALNEFVSAWNLSTERQTRRTSHYTPEQWLFRYMDEFCSPTKWRQVHYFAKMFLSMMRPLLQRVPLSSILCQKIAPVLASTAAQLCKRTANPGPYLDSAEQLKDWTKVDTTRPLVFAVEQNQRIVLYCHPNKPSSLNPLELSHFGVSVVELNSQSGLASTSHILSSILGENILRSAPSARQVESTYQLTKELQLRLVISALRLSCNIPVILLAEVGAGKRELRTSLMDMCAVESFRRSIFTVYPTTTATVLESWLIEKVQEARMTSANFFVTVDQSNLSNCGGILSSLAVDRICNGVDIPDNLKVILTGSPYRRLVKAPAPVATPRAGLTRSSSSTSVRVTASLPYSLSELVYPVYPLPYQLLQYATQFASLTPENERRLALDIVLRECQVCRLSLSEGNLNDFVKKILASHEFIRSLFGRESVSLRDVLRTAKIFTYFASASQKNVRTNSAVTNSADHVYPTCSVLAICYCYYLRLQGEQRQKFIQQVGLSHVEDVLTAEMVRIGIAFSAERDRQGSRLELPPHTMLNEALKENIFMIVVSILNKQPLFIVGESGSSKSLAVEVVANSTISQRDSVLPSLEFFSLTCTAYTSSAELRQLFEDARKFQSQHPDARAVVVLHELGVLQSVHPLREELDKQEIAIIALSNENNPNLGSRLLTVERSKPSQNDLARSFLQVQTGTHSCGALFFSLSHGFSKFISQHSGMHGLRDFYQLYKYVSRRLQNSPEVNQIPTILLRGIRRCFGGSDEALRSAEAMFFNSVGYQKPDTPYDALDCVKDNLLDKNSRHLMLITKANVALNILFEQGLLHHGNTEVLFGVEPARSQNVLGSTVVNGTQYFDHLRIIKQAMADGKVLVLVNCEGLFSTSLYDLFQQTYVEYGTRRRFVKLKIGDVSKQCRVSKYFKLIVCIDKDVAATQSKTVLSQFDKVSLVRNDLTGSITKHPHSVYNNLKARISMWARDISLQTEEGGHVPLGYTFSGFSDSLFECLAFRLASDSSITKDVTIEELFERAQTELLQVMTADGVIRTKERLGAEYVDTYFLRQQHRSLIEVLCALSGNMTASLAKVQANEENVSKRGRKHAKRKSTALSVVTSSAKSALPSMSVTPPKTAFKLEVSTYSDVSLQDLVEVLDKHNGVEYRFNRVHVIELHEWAARSQRTGRSIIPSGQNSAQEHNLLVVRCDMHLVTDSSLQFVRYMIDRDLSLSSSRPTSPAAPASAAKSFSPSQTQWSVLLIILTKPGISTDCNRYEITLDDASWTHSFLDELMPFHPDVYTMLTSPLREFMDSIDIQRISQEHIRSAVAVLRYPTVAQVGRRRVADAALQDHRARIRRAQACVMDSKFWPIAEQKLRYIIAECYSKDNSSYWSERVAQNPELLASAGPTFRLALSQVSSSMVQRALSVLWADTDRNNNINLFVRYVEAKDEVMQNLFLQLWQQRTGTALLADQKLDGQLLTDLSTELLLDVVSDGQSRPFNASFPFSFVLCPVIDALKHTMASMAATAEMARTLDRLVLVNFPALSSLSLDQCLLYMRDYIAMYGYPCQSVNEFEHYQVFEVLLKCSSVYSSCTNRRELGSNSTAGGAAPASPFAIVQHFYWTIERRLKTYFALMDSMPGVAKIFIDALVKGDRVISSADQMDCLLYDSAFEILDPYRLLGSRKIITGQEDMLDMDQMLQLTRLMNERRHETLLTWLNSFASAQSRLDELIALPPSETMRRVLYNKNQRLLLFSRILVELAVPLDVVVSVPLNLFIQLDEDKCLQQNSALQKLMSFLCDLCKGYPDSIKDVRQRCVSFIELFVQDFALAPFSHADELDMLMVQQLLSLIPTSAPDQSASPSFVLKNFGMNVRSRFSRFLLYKLMSNKSSAANVRDHLRRCIAMELKSEHLQPTMILNHSAIGTFTMMYIEHMTLSMKTDDLIERIDMLLKQKHGQPSTTLEELDPLKAFQEVAIVQSCLNKLLSAVEASPQQEQLLQCAKQLLSFGQYSFLHRIAARDQRTASLLQRLGLDTLGTISSKFEKLVAMLWESANSDVFLLQTGGSLLSVLKQAQGIEKFELLRTFLIRLDDFPSLKHLPYVIRWNTFIQQTLGGKVDVAWAKSHSVSDVLAQKSGGSEHKSLRLFFDSYARAFNKVRTESMPIMSLETTVNWCMEVNLAHILIQKHNKVVDDISNVMRRKQDARLRRPGHVHQHIQTHSAIPIGHYSISDRFTMPYQMFSFDEDEFTHVIVSRALADSGTAAGSMQFDFERIEQFVFEKYLSGKPRILETPSYQHSLYAADDGQPAMARSASGSIRRIDSSSSLLSTSSSTLSRSVSILTSDSSKTSVRYVPAGASAVTAQPTGGQIDKNKILRLCIPQRELKRDVRQVIIREISTTLSHDKLRAAYKELQECINWIVLATMSTIAQSDAEQARRLLNHAHLVQQPIATFLEDFLAITPGESELLKCSSIVANCKLSNLYALARLLEAQIHYGDPLAAVQDEFRAQLTPAQQQELRAKLHQGLETAVLIPALREVMLNYCCNSEELILDGSKSLKLVLGTLPVQIEQGRIRSASVALSQATLPVGEDASGKTGSRTMQSTALEQTQLSDVKWFQDHFPSSLTFSQIYAAYDLIVANRS